MEKVGEALRQLRKQRSLELHEIEAFFKANAGAHSLRSTLGELANTVRIVEKDPKAYERWTKSGRPFAASLDMPISGRQIPRKPGC